MLYGIRVVSQAHSGQLAAAIDVLLYLTACYVDMGISAHDT